MTPPPFVLADGSTAPFNLVVRVFENTLHVKLGDPTDVKRRVLERKKDRTKFTDALLYSCLLYTSPSPRDTERSRMPSSA